MVYFVGFLMFAALSAAAWFVSIAMYRSTFAGPDPSATPGYPRVAAIAIGTVTLTCFSQFPAGYLFGVVVWAITVFGFLNLPRGRAAALVAYLAAASFVERLAVLGALEMF